MEMTLHGYESWLHTDPKGMPAQGFVIVSVGVNLAFVALDGYAWDSISLGAAAALTRILSS